MKDPVFIVGMPRSGSTMLSRIVNESESTLCLNDLYYVQLVLERGLQDGNLNRENFELLKKFLIDFLLLRSKYNDSFTGQIVLDDSQIENVQKNIEAEFAKNGYQWHELIDDCFSQIAGLAGKTRWGEKTPQNFFHMEYLKKVYQNCQFLFLIRDPRNVMTSYKFAPVGSHRPERYHPVVYALYWRTMARKAISCEGDAAVCRVRYEDILQHTGEQVKKLSEFLHAPFSNFDLAGIGNNSSFKKRDKKHINGLEIKIAQWICKKEMQTLGYEKQDVSVSVGDLWELLVTSVTFAGFQIGRLVTSRDGRMRVKSFIRNLISPRKS